MKVFSLAAVTMVLTNPNYAGGSIITIGGGGNGVGSIGYAYNSEMFNISALADGGYGASHNNNRSGNVTLQLQQTSATIADLTDFLLWCWDNPTLAASSITVRDNVGNINFEAIDVLPQKLPDNTVNETVGNRTFTFLAGKITSKENQGGN